MSDRWLRANPTDDILIQGYADERGTKEYNLALAERRARSLRDQLVARGIEPGRIVLASYGVGRPVCTEKTDSCWGQNRRADILVRVLRIQSP
jgi:peptidoglycan-associated lipoprotein